MSTPLLLSLISGFLLLCFGGYSAMQVLTTAKKRKGNMNRRLLVEDKKQNEMPAAVEETQPETGNDTTAKKALDIATGGDKEKIARIRRMLIQAGEFDAGAVAKFALQRFVFGGFGLIAAIIFALVMSISLLTTKAVTIVFGLTLFGYFLPSLILKQKIKARRSEYRNGFPDFMDLMIVCADAGLSLEASVDRVARELNNTYPYLSHNLMTFSLELRAGRSINEAMKTFGERVGLDEVDAFAVLLKQSKELGTSLSGTLRVFSEEMRDKRMSMAEEKAHALPAKMTIPVTMCILPTVVMIAIIPVIVKLGGAE